MVEDIHIMRYSKEAGYRNHTLLSNGQISCRMYPGAKEAVNGFAKNVLAFFGSSVPFAGFHLLTTTLGFIPMLYVSLLLQITWLSLIVVIRLATSAASRQNPLMNLLMMPVQQLMFALFFLRAVRVRAGKGYQWKGRKV